MIVADRFAVLVWIGVASDLWADVEKAVTDSLLGWLLMIPEVFDVHTRARDNDQTEVVEERVVCISRCDDAEGLTFFTNENAPAGVRRARIGIL